MNLMYKELYLKIFPSTLVICYNLWDNLKNDKMKILSCLKFALLGAKLKNMNIQGYVFMLLVCKLLFGKMNYLSYG